MSRNDSISRHVLFSSSHQMELKLEKKGLVVYCFEHCSYFRVRDLIYSFNIFYSWVKSRKQKNARLKVVNKAIFCKKQQFEWTNNIFFEKIQLSKNLINVCLSQIIHCYAYIIWNSNILCQVIITILVHLPEFFIYNKYDLFFPIQTENIS